VKTPNRAHPRHRRSIRKVVAVLALGGVIGVGAVAAPAIPAPPASAGWTNTTDSWAKSMGTTLNAASKIFNFEKAPGFLGAVGVLAFAGPILTAIFGGDSGPTIQDVLDKLDDIENRLDDIEAELTTVSHQIDTVDADVLLGTCQVETSALTDLLTRVETAQMAYAAVVDATRATQDAASAQQLKRVTSAFVETVFGAGQSAQILVSSTDMGRALTGAHNRLVSTPGSAGVIETCGRAFHKQWANERSTAASGLGATGNGAWLDDRDYYQPLQDLLRYWQTVQAQGLMMLQQAAYLQAVVGYQSAGNALSPDDGAQACASVSQDSDAYGLCTSARTFSDTFFANVTAEWQQAGVPYTDDRVVLSLGTAASGVPSSGGATPSILWVRDNAQIWQPTADGGASDDGRAGYALTPDYDGFSDWSVASDADWDAMIASYTASHPATAPASVESFNAVVRAMWDVTDSAGRNLFAIPAGTRDYAPVLIALFQQTQAVHAVPTDGTCTTRWGVPSRCGTPFDTWATANIPDPSVPAPLAMTEPTVGPGDTADRAVCVAPEWQSMTGTITGGTVEYGDATWTAVAADGESAVVTKPWGEALSLVDDVLPSTPWEQQPASFAVACQVSASFAGEANVTEVPSSALAVSLVDGAWRVGVQAPAGVTESPQTGVTSDGSDTTLSATFAVPQGEAANVTGTDAAPADGGIPTPTPTAGSTPAALGAGRGTGLAMSRVLAADPASPVTWEKRESGTDDWVVVELPARTTTGTEPGVPHAVARDTVRTELELTGISSADHGDQYRASYTTASGVQLTSEPTRIQVASVVKPWLPGLIVAVVLVAMMLGGVFVANGVRSRRRRA
jgi:uncharacterized membrane protein